MFGFGSALNGAMHSLRALHQQLRTGAVRARDLAEGALAAMTHDAYRAVDPDRVRAAAEAADAALSVGADPGPLAGIPVSVKDLYGVPGYPTSAGTGVDLPERFTVPGPLIRRALDQLAVVTGKTHTVEFAFGGIGTNAHTGTPQNPWDRERVPGGSSAGAGVSLAEGSARLAFGTDTAGSVRIPAAWTGTVGLKTTAGRWSTQGIVPLSRTLDTAGILTCTVDDAIFAFQDLDPRSPRIEDRSLPGIRMGVGRDDLFWTRLSPGVAEAVEAAIADLQLGGALEIPFTLSMVEGAQELFGVGGPVAAELYHFLSRQLPDRFEALHPNVRSRIGDAGNLPTHEYLYRLDRIRELGAEANGALAEVDVLITPTVANTPPTVASLEDPDRYREQNLLCLRNTAMVSYLGLCALSLPVGTDRAGMPVGMQLVARAHREPELLAVARAFERCLGQAPERLGTP